MNLYMRVEYAVKPIRNNRGLYFDNSWRGRSGCNAVSIGDREGIEQSDMVKRLQY